MTTVEILRNELQRKSLTAAEKLRVLVGRAGYMGYNFSEALDTTDISVSAWVSGQAKIPDWIYPSLVLISGGWITEADLKNQVLPIRAAATVGKGKGKRCGTPVSSGDLGVTIKKPARKGAAPVAVAVTVAAEADDDLGL